MTVPMRCRFRPGGTIGPNHTVLAVVDKAPGRHPVLIVWDHRSWCPMACKLFASPEKAAEEALEDKEKLPEPASALNNVYSSPLA